MRSLITLFVVQWQDLACLGVVLGSYVVVQIGAPTPRVRFGFVHLFGFDYRQPFALVFADQNMFLIMCPMAMNKMLLHRH